MAKVRLQLGAELDMLTKDELDDSLGRHSGWEREAAFGVRHQDLPKMTGIPSAGALLLGYDQPDQVYCGPREGWYWAVHRIAVDGLATGDAVRLYKETRFIGWLSYQPGFVTFGKGACMFKPGDYLRVVGSGLTATGQVEVYGEAVSAPAEMVWKLVS